MIAMDVLSMMGVALVALMITLSAVRSWPEWQRTWTLAALGFHALCCLAQVAITRFVYRGGDIDLYFRYGLENAESVLRDPGLYGPEVFAQVAQQSTSLAGFGSATTNSMVGLVTLSLFPTFFSFMGACMLFGMLSFSGKLAMFKAFEPFVHPIVRKRLFFACLFVPSMVFWSSAIMKESVAMCMLGWTMWACVSLWLGKRSPLVFIVGIGAVWILSMVKAYILLAWAISLGVWFVWWSMLKQGNGVEALLKKPLYLVLGAVATVGIIVAVGELAPRYSATSVLEEAAYVQEMGTRVSGGSNIGGAGDLGSSAGRIQAIPVALMTALFRPFIFEVHNAVALVNALETTGVLILFVLVLARRGIVQTARTILKTPALMFCVTFTVIFAIGVGVSTTNLGTMSRYRIPMLPFYFATLLLLYPVAVSRGGPARA